MSERKGVNPLTKEECVFKQSRMVARFVRWRTRPRQVLHVGSLFRRSAHWNSSAAVSGTHLGHREHDDSRQ